MIGSWNYKKPNLYIYKAKMILPTPLNIKPQKRSCNIANLTQIC